MKIYNKLYCVGLLSILILILLIICRNSKRENFEDMLEKVDVMGDKLGSLVDQEVETRTFCKLLRHDSNFKEPMKKLLEQRNIEFSKNWKKQNRMLADIKKKIIEMKLGKDNQNFATFNSKRNKDKEANRKRNILMDKAMKMIKQKPVINFTVDNNI